MIISAFKAKKRWKRNVKKISSESKDWNTYTLVIKAITLKKLLLLDCSKVAVKSHYDNKTFTSVSHKIVNDKKENYIISEKKSGFMYWVFLFIKWKQRLNCVQSKSCPS